MVSAFYIFYMYYRFYSSVSLRYASLTPSSNKLTEMPNKTE